MRAQGSSLAGYGSQVGGYRPVTFEQFPGLDLKSAPDQSGCVDMLNVDITLDGNLRSRDGTVVFSTSDVVSSAGGTLSGLFAYHGTTSNQLVAVYRHSASSNATYVPISATGVLGTAFDSGGGATDLLSAAQVGTPTGAVMYFTAGTNSVPVWVKFDGTTFTQPTVTVDGVAGKVPPVPRTLVTSPIDNRLVIGGTVGATSGPNSAASSGSHVWFTDPGLPEQFGTATSIGSNNFVQLGPGDGESIQGAVAWRELVFIFKQSRFWVLFGVSTDSTGKPIFNFRPVDTGVGIERAIGVIPTLPPVCAAPDGVYFANQRGIYRTTGQAPVKISTPLDPLFQGGATAFWQGGTSIGVLSLSYFNERLYAVVGSTVATANNMVLVYDPRNGVDRWVVWQVGTLATVQPVSFAPTTMSAQGLYFGHGLRVRQFSSSATDDAGTAITSRYRSGFGFGGPDQTTVRETILDGSGTPTLQWSRDWGSLVTGSAVTLGTAPALAVGRQRLAIRGRRFSWQIGDPSRANLIASAGASTLTTTATTGWTPTTAFNNAGAVLTGVAAPTPVYGTGAMRVTTDGINPSEGAACDLTGLGAFSGTLPYTFAIYMQGAVGGEVVFVILGSVAEFQTSAALTLTTAWKRYTVTWVPSVNRTGVSAVIQRSFLAAPATFYMNAAQVVSYNSAPSFDGAWSLQRLEAQQRDLRESSVTV